MKKLLFIVSLLFAANSFGRNIYGLYIIPHREPKNSSELLFTLFSDQLTSKVLAGTFLLDAGWEYAINQNFRNATISAVSGIGVLVVSRKARNYMQKAWPKILIDDDYRFVFKFGIFSSVACSICFRLYCGINGIRM